MPSIQGHIQKSELGAEIKLVEIDLTEFGEGVLRWVVGDEGSIVQQVTFGGHIWTPFPVRLEGFEMSASGPLPRPTVAVSDVGGLLTPIVNSNRNLIGAPFKRIITYDRFLDDGEEPDEEAMHPPDEYLLARKTQHKAGETIAWELQAHLDVGGAELPGRQVVRDFCDHDYRVYDPLTGDFDYTNATCTYTGDIYLDTNDQPCDKQHDSCSKRLAGGCKARFGIDAELPYRGFPAVNRTRGTT